MQNSAVGNGNQPITWHPNIATTNTNGQIMTQPTQHIQNQQPVAQLAQRMPVTNTPSMASGIGGATAPFHALPMSSASSSVQMMTPQNVQMVNRNVAQRHVPIGHQMMGVPQRQFQSNLMNNRHLSTAQLAMMGRAPPPAQPMAPMKPIAPMSVVTPLMNPAKSSGPSDYSGKLGHVNLGNTCFMNSVNQCLIHLPELKAYFLSEQFQKELNQRCDKYLRTKHIPRIEANYIALRQRSTLNSFYNMMYYSWKHGFPLRPVELHNSIKRMESELSARTPFEESRLHQHSQYSRFGQEDADDYLTFLLDRLHRELTVTKEIRFENPDPGMLRALQKHEEYRAYIRDSSRTEEEKMAATKAINQYRLENHNDNMLYEAYESWKGHIKCNGYSTINNLFDCIVNTHVNCLTCHTESNTFSVFTSFKLQIPKKKPIAKMLTLEECIDDFMKPELLLGDECYHCSLCNKKLPACKGFRIWEPAKHLIIQLKRFQKTNEGQTNFSASRIKIPIQYPSLLNLEPWVTQERRDRPYVFKLTGVCLHSGDVGGGHYTANCRIGEEWFHFDDGITPAQQITEHQALNEHVRAYLLFYELQDSPPIIPPPTRKDPLLELSSSLGELQLNNVPEAKPAPENA
jgi:ubiquitin C-terminal hydrolase